MGASRSVSYVGASPVCVLLIWELVEFEYGGDVVPRSGVCV